MALRFPDKFLWGAATSAYQIEGSPLADGAGESNWYRFSHTPGKTEAHADIACDHYRRWQSDVALMTQLGINAYRFSIAWSRVLPKGTGSVNYAGLDFYDRLVDGLLASDIVPFVTLFHWDLPAALETRGGFLNRDSAEWFADYANIVFDRLGDRVAHWATLNEPWVVMDAGFVHGVHAPGHRSWSEGLQVMHNLLRAHGNAVRAYRSVGRGHIGLVVNLEPKYAASDNAADRAAAARAGAYMNRICLDPIFRGHYPEELPEIFGDAWPVVTEADLALIREPTDYLGINYYTRNVVRDDPGDPPLRAARVRQDAHVHTLLDWEVYPQALTDVLLWVRERYGERPIYITENGAAFEDPAHAGIAGIDDPLRVAYYRDHIRAVHAAMQAGADVRGYFAWSLMDNCEWSAGYKYRFGLYHVNFDTQERTLKASGKFYSDVVRSNGEVLGSDTATR